jgi:shikimate dehydrogenase
LPRLLDEAEGLGFAGLNITYPCKQAVLPLLHELSDEARALQSVNTVVFKQGKRYGHNTDWWGFAESFTRFLAPVTMRRVVLVGAGGAGAAVGYAALRLGVETLLIHDQEPARAEALAQRLRRLFADRNVSAVPEQRAALAAADGLIHASPVGMAKLPGLAVPPECIQPPLWVAEVVYVPLETELLTLARSRGCKLMHGGNMAVLQAARAFALFCGIEPDCERMLARFPAQVQR